MRRGSGRGNKLSLKKYDKKGPSLAVSLNRMLVSASY